MIHTITKAQKDQIAAFEEAIKGIDKDAKESLVEAIRKFSEDIPIGELEEAVATGSLQSVVTAIGVSRLGDALRGAGVPIGDKVFFDEVTRSYSAGAKAGLMGLPPKISTKAVFDIQNPRVVEWAKSNRASMIREITKSTEDAINAILIRGIREQRTPRQIAADIKRIVGLTEAQAQAVVNFRNQLIERNTMGLTPPAMRRLDAATRQRVKNQIKTGKLKLNQIDEIVEKYRKSLIALRAETIARTETLRAASAGQNEAWSQARDQGLLDDDQRKQWVYTKDDRTRNAHRSIPRLNGGGIPLDGTYKTPLGQMKYPRDPNGSASNTIGCRCTEVLIGL